MQLQMNYASAEAVPEPYRDLYSPDESGVWHLTGVEDLPSRKEMDLLRAELEKEKSSTRKAEEIFRKFGRDPKELENYASEHEKLKTDLADAQGKLEECSRKIRAGKIEQTLRETASLKGIRPEAVRDVLARASLFTVTPEGEVRTIAGGEDAASWMSAQLKQSPHWLAPSRSAGAHTPSGSGYPGKRITLSDLISETWNQTTRR